MNKHESYDWTIQRIKDSEDSIDWDFFCEHFIVSSENTSSSDICLYYIGLFYFFEEKINWSAFCKNKNIHWNHFFRKIFPHEITHKYFQYNIFNDKNGSEIKGKLIALKGTKNINIFNICYEKLDWQLISSNYQIPLEFWVNSFKYPKIISQLNFKAMSALKNIPWDLTLHWGFEKNSVLDFSEKWDWEQILVNKSIKWNKKMIMDHAKHLPWQGKSGGPTGKYWYHPSKVALFGSHISFPCEVLKEHTTNWIEGMFDGCERTDSEGDWIIFSRNHNINYEILKEFGSKLDLVAVIENKKDWTIKELKLMKNIILERKLYFQEYAVFKKLISNKNVQELIQIEILKNL